MKTIAIDFDGVIHKYSKGWQDGEIYDEPIDGAFKAIENLFKQGYSVFIFSTRSSRQIKNWIKVHTWESEYTINGLGNDPQDFLFPIYGFDVQVIPFWKKFWNKKNVLGVTNRKLPATSYLDDRAINFNGDWQESINLITKFKTYQEL